MRYLALAALLALVLPACHHHRVVIIENDGHGRAEEVIVYEAPPRKPRAVVVKGNRPGAKHVWVAGNWTWRKGRYVWISGHWAKPPKHGWAWVPGHWTRTPNGGVWNRGRWVLFLM